MPILKGISFHFHILKWIGLEQIVNFAGVEAIKRRSEPPYIVVEGASQTRLYTNPP